MSTDTFVAQMVDAQVRVEGADVWFEVQDKLDPRQLSSRIIFHEPCTCGLDGEHADFPHCQCGAATQALELSDTLRKAYATQIDLHGRVRSVVRA